MKNMIVSITALAALCVASYAENSEPPATIQPMASKALLERRFGELKAEIDELRHSLTNGIGHGHHTFTNRLHTDFDALQNALTNHPPLGPVFPVVDPALEQAQSINESIMFDCVLGDKNTLTNTAEVILESTERYYYPTFMVWDKGEGNPACTTNAFCNTYCFRYREDNGYRYELFTGMGEKYVGTSSTESGRRVLVCTTNENKTVILGLTRVSLKSWKKCMGIE